ncbi:TRAP transporter fused permease subunit [Bacillus sp. ISL-47]|uniref:TRAP transporter permease n=1 Tax=Bacillus sp. ISL-47 TaxID=2819130 RepID=UPI001BE76091|nr:TRAP transporter fused permease subunit [Bacillus sp. ISL-47]MBT2689835.1 TRAP transporter fused permease subunit [Bacillus sp. ISL-47]MBT2710212.1 TRAP transporter fused permease subunit [Pseudomonas sp. ISL-84]
MSKILNQLEELFTEDESEIKKNSRNLSKKYLVFVGAVGLIWALFHIYTMGFGTLPGIIQRSLHLIGATIICFLIFSGSTKFKNNKWLLRLDLLFILLACIVTVYVISIYPRIIEQHGVYNTTDIIMATILLMIVLEGARRVLGWFIPFLVICGITYAVLGPYFPGIWRHAGIGYERLMQTFLLGTQGIWGQLMSISANILVIFVLYGSLILSLGLGNTIFDLGSKLTGKWRGGAAQLATVTSALFGSVNGSTVANVATTGNFTIPLMKRLGYNKNFAGAVESVASSGGQIMPPVMGASAFLMAELLALNYVDVMIAALIPALLFFVSIMISIYFYARANHLTGLSDEEIPTWKQAFNWRTFIPLFVPLILLVALLFSGYTAGKAGYTMYIGTIVLYFLCNVRSKKEFKEAITRIISGLDSGAKSMVTIVMLIAAAQTLVTTINTSGLGVKFSLVTMSFSQGNLFLALILAMVITIILGMGAPTPAAYVLSASVIGSALINLGIEGIAAHMFLLYFAVLSAITPPVCAAIYVACGISKGDWVKTAIYSLKIGLTAFIIPFMFVLDPVLLMKGEPIDIILSVATALAGVVILAVGTMGILINKANIAERLIAFAAAILLLFPGHITDVIGISLFVIMCLIHWKGTRSSRKSEHALSK